MGKIQIPRKIRTEDFKSDQQELAGKIGDIYNQFADDVYNTLNGRIDGNNLNRQLVDIIIMMSSTGLLVSQPQVKLTVIGKPRGINVINAINVDDPGTYPTTAPFISWNINGGIMTILNVSGLQNSSQYKLTLEIVV